MLVSAAKSVRIVYAIGILSGGSADRRNNEAAALRDQIRLSESVRVGVRRLFIDRLERIAVEAEDLLSVVIAKSRRRQSGSGRKDRRSVSPITHRKPPRDQAHARVGTINNALDNIGKRELSDFKKYGSG